jgi:superfamily II DNA or RNA helicase
MVELREYQKTAVNEIRSGLARYRRVVCVMPTGSGKGTVLGYVASLAANRGTKTLILAHREEIMKQNAGHCRKCGVEPQIISPKHRKVPTEDVVCGMVQTLQRRIEKTEWMEYVKSVQMLVLDEAHICNYDFLFDIISDKCYVIGYTATMARYGGMTQAGLQYNAMVLGPSVKELINLGYLCRCRLYSLDAPSMDDVAWDYGRGDYNLGQMAAKFKSRARYVGAVENYQRICPGEKAIVFACSSEQCIGLTQEFNNHGISAKYLLSNSFDEDEELSGERKRIVEDFENNKFKVLVNLGIGVAGLDIVDIKVVMLMYSTTSVVKYLQSCGRASRPAPGKNNEFICLDFGRNYERLGRYEDDRTYSLWHNTGSGGGVAPTKECDGCGRLVPVSWTDCQFCGYHFPTEHEIYRAELQEIVAQKTEEETLEQYVARRKLEGWSNNRILVAVCIKNADNQKEAFMKAIEVLRTKHGANVSPKFWYFFKREILSKVKVRKDEGPKLW